MVANYRASARHAGIDTSNYTDAELFDVIEYWSGMSTIEEQLAAVLDDLRIGVKRDEP